MTQSILISTLIPTFLILTIAGTTLPLTAYSALKTEDFFEVTKMKNALLYVSLIFCISFILMIFLTLSMINFDDLNLISVIIFAIILEAIIIAAMVLAYFIYLALSKMVVSSKEEQKISLQIINESRSGIKKFVIDDSAKSEEDIKNLKNSVPEEKLKK